MGGIQACSYRRGELGRRRPYPRWAERPPPGGHGFIDRREDPRRRRPLAASSEEYGWPSATPYPREGRPDPCGDLQIRAAEAGSRHGGDYPGSLPFFGSERLSSTTMIGCIESWVPDEQRRAYEVIARFERDGLDRLQINPGDWRFFH